VVVVLAPGMGDGIQAAKAGILEIADILVVNKSDHDGASGTVRDLKGMVALGRAGAEPHRWRVPVLSTIASKGNGVDELLEALAAHRQHLDSTGGRTERRHLRAEVAVQAVVLERVLALLGSQSGQERVAAAARPVADGRIDHHRAAEEVLEWLHPRSTS
jgi:LAO/AO transport system kinase